MRSTRAGRRREKHPLGLVGAAGRAAQQFSEGTIVGLPVQDVQIDELWSFVGCKERTRKLNSKPVGSCGDQYCFTALERNTKLLLAWHMGDRLHSEGVAFVRKLARSARQTNAKFRRTAGRLTNT